MRMLDVSSLEIAEVRLIRTGRIADSRGYFFESWNRRTFEAAGIRIDFVQNNCSYSKAEHTIRGLHFQTAPHAQAKLVRVVRGSILDVAVDLRASSDTYRRWVSAVLTAEGGEQMLVPVGFAHGYCTLEPHTEAAYKVSAFYAPEHEAGISWNDPDIGIEWPLSDRAPVLSEEDAHLPRLADATFGF